MRGFCRFLMGFVKIQSSTRHTEISVYLPLLGERDDHYRWMFVRVVPANPLDRSGEQYRTVKINLADDYEDTVTEAVNSELIKDFRWHNVEIDKSYPFIYGTSIYFTLRKIHYHHRRLVSSVEFCNL